MLRNKLQQYIKTAIDLEFPSHPIENVEVTHPSQVDYGDYSTNIAMIMARATGKKPHDVASNLVGLLRNNADLSELLSEIHIAGPGFINFYIKDEIIWNEAQRHLTMQERHQDTPGHGKRVMVEFSSPNIAKPFNVGHLRSTIIGDSIARVLTYMGYEVLRDNHIGDWGTQYGKLAYAVDNWGDWAAIEANPIPELFKLYVQFHQKEEVDPELTEKGREYFKRLENKDADVVNTWQRLVELSNADFDKLYAKLNVKFDMQLGESFYEPMLAEIIDECNSSGIAKKSDGATLIFFNEDPQLKDAPLMIQKSNGTSTYGTRDLAGIKYRINEFNLDQLIIEIGNEQQLYFKQVIKASEMLGWVKPGQLMHVGHGLFMLPTGKMSTRKGETVWVSDLVSELEQKAMDIVSRREELSDSERREAAEAIAVGALKYNDLSQNRLGNVVFDKDKSLALDGNSAPYLQYTIARSKSILRSANEIEEIQKLFSSLPDKSISMPDNIEPIERELLAIYGQFDEVIQDTSLNLLPNTLTNYLYNLAQKYNSYYQSFPILNSDEKVRVQRILIVLMAVNILTVGLNLLGIKAVERM